MPGAHWTGRSGCKIGASPLRDRALGASARSRPCGRSPPVRVTIPDAVSEAGSQKPEVRPAALRAARRGSEVRFSVCPPQTAYDPELANMTGAPESPTKYNLR
jgi:hypothetical protein